MSRPVLLFLIGIFLLSNSACGQSADSESHAFAKKWYQGLAEINTYTLQQVRYGAVHEGEAVLIYVTEPFSRSEHVKLDRPERNPEDAVTVMKLNKTKQFNTGVYQYNMMQSVFTPVATDQYPRTLKITTGIQDWCGQVFMQCDLNGVDGYRVRQFSYFESEGDKNMQLPGNPILEDDIWTRIRLAPEDLPEGDINMVPGSFYVRLKHKAFKPYGARATLREDRDTRHYTIEYPELDRALTIHFKTAFPHEITGWEESYPDGDGAGRMVTKAQRKAVDMMAYWQKNSPSDLALRDKLKLD